MGEPDDIITRVVGERVRKAASEALQRVEVRRKRHTRSLARLFKIAASLAFATFAILVTMIATGLLFGPTGAEGWLAAPIALIVAWTAILYAFRVRKHTPSTLASGDIKQLAARTGDWLELQRSALPAPARQKVDGILLRLEALDPQLRLLDANQPAAAEVRRLIGEELPELVGGYQKVPAAFKQTPVHGGPTPDQQLLEGLSTVDEELARMHSRLAVNDLHALATQKRYLETKYKRNGDIE